MSQMRRVAFGVKFTILMALLALFHFRMGVDHLYPLATNDFPGPFTGAVETLEWIMPIVIGVMLLAVWVWVLISPTQEERTVREVR